MVSRRWNRWRKVSQRVRSALSMQSSSDRRAIGKHDRAGEQDIEQRQRQHHLPAAGHELVVTRPRQSRTQENKKSDEESGLDQKPQERRQRRPAPAAEEQRRDYCRNQDDADVFRNEEHAELHAGIFGMEAGAELILSLRKIEWQSTSLRNPGNHEDHKPEKLGNDEP